jgi:hypothetical protein
MKTHRSAILGKRGGQARSERKSVTARQNIRLRWHRRHADGVIPEAALIDGAWYQGSGRTAPIALWDAHTKTFHTVTMSSFSDPEDFPRVSRRETRLKQETHSDNPGGSFSPMRILAAE